MKLVSYAPRGVQRARIGALCRRGETDCLIDVVRAYALALRRADGDPLAEQVAAARIPGELIGLIAGGPATLQAVEFGVRFVEEALADDRHVREVREAGEECDGLAEVGVVYRRDQVRILAPIPRPGKIVAIGANYHAHIREGRESGAIGGLPSHAPAFLKMPSSVIGCDEAIVYPTFGSELDYEVELAMVVGCYCQDVREEDWLDVVFGFTIINDLGLRDVIFAEKDTGIVLAGKNFATACPMGPCIVTKDSFRTPDDVALSLRVNGELRQKDRTASMIHRCGAIIAYWSRLGLEPGDIVTTGTPGGSAGFSRRYPERLLKVGDVVEAEIDGIGVLRNPIVAAGRRSAGATTRPGMR